MNQPMNPPLNQNPLLTQNPSMNQNQGPMVATISTEPRIESVDITVLTQIGAKTGEDGLHPEIQLDGQKKAPFDITTKKETFFGAQDAIERNIRK